VPPQVLDTVLRDPSRLAAVAATGLLDAEPDESLERLGRLARHLLGTPVALVTLIDSSRQYFACRPAGAEGDGSEWLDARETPLSYSVCQYALTYEGPLIVEDARTDPRLVGNRAVELGTVAYLGIPLVDAAGNVLGSFCVIDRQPRQWTDGEVALMVDLAAAVMAELALRTVLRRVDIDSALMRDLIDALPTFVGVLDPTGRVTYVNAAALSAASVTLADVVGLPFWETTWWSSAEASSTAVRNAVDQCALGTTCRFDVEFRAADGPSITVDLQLAPILDVEGRVVAMVPSALDITERMRTHRELVRLADVETLARLRSDRMFQLARALTGATDVGSILQRTSRIGGELAGAAFANIGIADPAAGEIEMWHSAGIEQDIKGRWPRVAMDMSTPMGAVMLTGEPIELAGQAEMSERFPSGADDAQRAGFVALAAYPIQRGRTAMGFAWTQPVVFDDEMRNTLSTVVELVGLGLQRAETNERDRRVAEQLQRSMLPARLPRVPGVSLGALYEAGTRGLQIGGDWYDVAVAPDGRVLLGLGDVVGHGLQAASAMGQMRTAFAALAPIIALEDLVERLSGFSVNVRGALLSTMAVAEFSPDLATVRIVSAGHVPPMVRRADGSVEQLPDGGLPLGIEGSAPRAVITVALAPGDTVALYSDGLVERRVESIDVGLARLRRVLKSASVTDGQAMVNFVFEALERPRADDVAMLVLRRD
jgi:PAS domain S-box-containing protein